MEDALPPGSAVRVVGSRVHAGKIGKVVKYTAEMVEVQTDDGGKLRVKKTNIQALRPSSESLSASSNSGSAEVCARKTGPSRSFAQADFDTQSSDSTTASSFARDDSKESDTISVTSMNSSRSLGLLSLAATTVSAAGSVAQMTFGGLAWGGRAIAHIVVGGRKEPMCFLRWFFREDLLEIRPKNGVEHAAVEEDFEGRTYELCASKVDSEGRAFWGGSIEVVRLFYILKRPQEESLQARLEGLAGFGELREACKVASRLELLVSSAPPDRYFEMKVSDFEQVSEPQPSSESGGCGFIPEAMLVRFFGSGVKGKRTTNIQVRIVAPALGIFKGVLSKKRGISKIQLPPSMRKVGPSLKNDSSSLPWVWVLITQDFPSSNNLQICKWIQGGTPCKSFRQPKFSKMLQRLMKSLGVPRDILTDFTKQDIRKESWVVGAADPTFPRNAVPAGHVFVSGLPKEHVPLIDGQHKVFLTRSPCTLPEHGHLLPLMTSRPAGVSEEDWRDLTERPFGEVLFSNTGEAIPEAISEGDLDGDRYYLCWDESIVRCIKPVLSTEVSQSDVIKKPSKKREPLGSKWFAEARDYMLSGEGATTKGMIGRLYCAGEKVADRYGLGHPDARAYFKAFTQAIDAGKHGNAIDLPEHLRESVGMTAGEWQ
eukprot:TRINITY_DN108996_c0_g1_i1.p1 TRINITY_DN108996_c0_g1~~TRINITY_DN108996_c0_g1_i1.p1  ORF type:complete len:654 (-),score=107.88 TRINITY_DN108996_c0_g1_i1:6-1967(-)